MKHLALIRQEYMKGALRKQDLNPNPFSQFGLWMEQAIGADVQEPTAMALSTVNERMQPSCRMVLLKAFNENGFQFFTNYESRKSKELAKNPNASLLFFWKELERQVRIEGLVKKMTEAESDEYFALRPRESQVGAWASPQSDRLQSRAELDSLWVARDLAFHDKAIPRPPHWGGFVLVPDYFEFWQGRESRLHDRFSWNKVVEGDWEIHRLAP